MSGSTEHLAPPEPSEPPAPRPSGPLRPYYELTKPGIAGFVTITAGTSFYVAAGGRPELVPVLQTMLGTALATGGALALNQYVERDLDARMKRTRRRPIPSGRVLPGRALTFGNTLLVLGVGWLLATLGWLPALITALSAAAYILLYTPLKRRSYLATLVGAVPGALPALIGWSAATGGLSLGGWVLFGIFFLWQLPHVLALAWLLKDDYRRVGFFLSPPTDPDGRRIGRHMVYHSISLLFLSLAPTLLGMAGWIYGGGAVVLGVGMLGACLYAANDMSLPRARHVFLASILYQPVLLGFLLLDTVRV